MGDGHRIGGGRKGKMGFFQERKKEKGGEEGKKKSNNKIFC